MQAIQELLVSSNSRRTTCAYSYLYSIVIRQEKDGRWTGRRMVEEQSPAHPAWRAHLISQHPPNEADAIVRRNRIFGLIAVGGCKRIMMEGK